MSRGPWETWSTRITPKMSPSPRATMAYSAPASRPEMTTWPSMAGVMTDKGLRLPLTPGRRREAELAAGQIIRPHDDPLAVLPLDHPHLVRRLEPVVVDGVIAKGRTHLELQQLGADGIG